MHLRRGPRSSAFARAFIRRAAFVPGMHPVLARRVLLGGLLATGALELLAAQTGAVWEPFVLFLWASFLAGPAFLLLLHGSMLSDGRPWLRVAAWALPPLSVLALAQEMARFVGVDVAAEVADRQRGLLVFHACLLLLALGMALAVLRRADARGWKVAGLVALASAALAATPLRDLTFLGLLAVQAVAFVALAGFHRAPAMWARAAAAGAGVLLAAGLILVAAFGSLLPVPRLGLGEDAAALVVLPVLALALLVPLGGLLAQRAAPAEAQPSPPSGAAPDAVES